LVPGAVTLSVSEHLISVPDDRVSVEVDVLPAEFVRPVDPPSALFCLGGGGELGKHE
jgi:hypothetical protein